MHAGYCRSSSSSSTLPSLSRRCYLPKPSPPHALPRVESGGAAGGEVATGGGGGQGGGRVRVNFVMCSYYLQCIILIRVVTAIYNPQRIKCSIASNKQPDTSFYHLAQTTIYSTNQHVMGVVCWTLQLLRRCRLLYHCMQCTFSILLTLVARDSE